MNQFARPGLAVTELPSFNENDKGKVLKIDSESGVLGWEEGSGGGGTGGGVLVVHDVNGVLDKTWKEISDAEVAVLRIEKDIGITCSISHSDGYSVVFSMLLPTGTGFDDPCGYHTDSESGYPVMDE